MSIALASAAAIPSVREATLNNGRIAGDHCISDREAGCHTPPSQGQHSQSSGETEVSQMVEPRSPQGSVTGEAMGGPFDAVAGTLRGVFRERRSPQGGVTGEALGGPFDAVAGTLGSVFRERRSPQGGVTGEAIGAPFNVVAETLGGVF